MPNFGVMRFAISADVEVCIVGGWSSVAPSVLLVMVGSESSSATNGSSRVGVAGKNRLPAKPWAKAGCQTARLAKSSPSPMAALGPNGKRDLQIISFSTEHTDGMRLGGRHRGRTLRRLMQKRQAACGGARGRADENNSSGRTLATAVERIARTRRLEPMVGRGKGAAAGLLPCASASRLPQPHT